MLMMQTKITNLCQSPSVLMCSTWAFLENMIVQFVSSYWKLKSTGGRALRFVRRPYFIVIAHRTLPFVTNHSPTWNRCFPRNPPLKVVSWRGPTNLWCALNDSCFSRQSSFCTSFIQIILLAAKSVTSSTNLVLKTHQRVTNVHRKYTLQ